MEHTIAEYRENERHIRTLCRIDEAEIAQDVPLPPKYTKVAIPFTKTVIEAFSREVHTLLHP